MGLEPTALGTTIRCSNQLSYSLRFRFEPQSYQKIFQRQKKSKVPVFSSGVSYHYSMVSLKPAVKILSKNAFFIILL